MNSDETYTDGLDEEEAFIATSFIEFHAEQPASGEWIPMTEEEARTRWEAWLAAHDEAVRQEEREKAAQISSAAKAAIKAVENHLLGCMEDGTYVAPDVNLTAREIRERLWELYDAVPAQIRTQGKEQRA